VGERKSLLAGSGEAGFGDGHGTAARFHHPNGRAVQVDPIKPKLKAPGTKRLKLKCDNLLVINKCCFQIKLAPLHNGIAVDNQGNMLVSDSHNHRIRRITPQGEVTTIAGTGAASFADGPAASAGFNHPRGIVAGAYTRPLFSST
jgi:hypothetical protein